MFPVSTSWMLFIAIPAIGKIPLASEIPTSILNLFETADSNFVALQESQRTPKEQIDRAYPSRRLYKALLRSIRNRWGVVTDKIPV